MSSDSTRRLALDIETISPHLSPDDDPDWENPEDFQLAAIGFAYDGPEAGGRLPRTQILTRRAPGLASELDLLRRINAELWAYQPDEIVTYAGDFFDLPMLKKRPVYAADGPAGDGLAGDIQTVIGSAKSVDLGDFAAETYGYGTRLDDLIQHQGVGLRRTMFDDYAHELDLESIRPSDADTDYVDSGDIPGIMETWLHARSDGHDDIGPCNLEEIERMVSDYILGDIEHLLTLSHRVPFSE